MVEDYRGTEDNSGILTLTWRQQPVTMTMITFVERHTRLQCTEALRSLENKSIRY